MKIHESLKYLLFLTFWLIVPANEVISQAFPSIKDLVSDSTFVNKLPVPVTSISSAIDQTSTLLTKMEESLASQSVFDKLDSTLNRYEIIIQESQEKYSPEILQSANAGLLKQYQILINQYIETVKSTFNVNLSQIKTSELNEKKIVVLKTIWETSLKAESSKDLSQAITIRINEILEEISRVKKNNDLQINKYLERQLKVSGMVTKLNEILDQIKIIEKELGKNILIPGEVPLWQLFSLNTDTISVNAKISKSIHEKKEDIKSYYAYYKQKIYISIACFFLFLAINVFLKKEIIKQQKVNDVEFKNSAIIIFNKPISIAIISALYFTAVIMPNRPLVINHILYLIAIFPLANLFIHILPSKYKKRIIYFAAIFLLTYISEELYDFKIINRILYMVISVSAFSWLWFILKNNWHGIFQNRTLIWWINTNGKILLVFLVVSFLGAITGNIELVNLLLYGTLNVIFITFFTYLLYLTITGIFIVIINGSWNNALPIVSTYHELIINRINKIVRTFFIFFYIYYIFNSFTLAVPIIELIVAIANYTMVIGSLKLTLLEIFNFFLILAISRWISQFIQFVLMQGVLFKSKNQKDFSASISSLVRFTIITVGFFMALVAAGFEMDRLALLISAFGVGIGFGLQSIFNNLVSGIILVFERPLQVGDTIEVGQLTGVVKSIGIRSSTIRTFDGAEVIVPNGNLISDDLINWTHSDLRRRLVTKVGVAYGTDPQKVIELLKEVAIKNDNILKAPAPYVLFMGFGDSSLDFELRCWTENFDNWIFILSDLKVQVNDAIIKAGINIPFPQRDLHVKTVNPQVIASVNPTKK